MPFFEFMQHNTISYSNASIYIPNKYITVQRKQILYFTANKAIIVNDRNSRSMHI